MRPRFEQVPLPHGQSFACLEYEEPVFDCPYHYHPEIEFTHILESRGTVMIGNGLGRFGPGDLYLIGSEVAHAFHNSPDWRRAGPRARSRVIQFRPDCLGDGFFDLPELRGVAGLLERACKGIRFHGALRERMADGMAETATRRGSARVVALLGLLDLAVGAHPDQWEPVATAEIPGGMSASDERRMTRVLDFIHAHLTRPLRVAEVAEVANLSPGSFGRFFRRSTKQTFVRFVNTLRLNLACERLATTDETITEIAYAVGFGNLANFNRRFLELHRRTPSAYRKECRAVAGADQG